MSAPVAIVAAVARNGVIGSGGRLPWKVKGDLRKFREITMGKPLVMGRKTFESVGRILDGRDNVVVTRQSGFSVPGAFVSESLEAAIMLAQKLAAGRGANEVCVGGGGEIYREAMPLADRLYITEIGLEPTGDTVFPRIDPEDWVEVSREAIRRIEGDTADAEHVVYARRR